MKRAGLLLMTLVVAVWAATAVAQVRADVALRAATEQETVKGDLKGAIEAYKKIVDGYPENRAVRAQALVRLAGCYEKLGNHESQKIYSRVVSEYPEQREAVAIARAALQPGKIMAQPQDRQIWSGPEVPVTAGVSADGRFLAYIDYERDQLVVRDLADGSTRTLVEGQASWAEDYVRFSADGRHLAYAWIETIGEEREQQLRVVTIPDKGSAPSVRVVSRFGRGPQAPWLGVYNWSADGKAIAVQTRGGSVGDAPVHEISVVDVSSGRVRGVKAVGPRLAMGVSLSPDGTRIAYDAPANATTAQRDIRLVAVSSGEESLVNASPGWESALGWSTDGQRLLYTSESGGSSTLFSQSIVDGKPAGAAVPLRSGFYGTPLGITRSGSVFVGIRNETQTVHVVPVDTTSGKLLGPATPVAGPKRRNALPRWSPDGRYLAYVSANARDWGISERVLCVLEVETQQQRILPLKLGQIWTWDWSPDGRSFLARATDFQNRMGIYQVDAISGNVTPILNNTASIRYFKPHWKDAASFYYTHNRIRSRNVLMLRNLLTGDDAPIVDGDKILAANPDFKGMVDWTASPDGRFVAGTQRRTVWLVSVADGTSRELYTADQPIRGYTLDWARDSSAVFATANNSADRREVWRLPLEGAPVKLELGLDHVAHDGLSIHPDGRRVAVQGGAPGPSEIRVLENVVPTRGAAAR